MCKSYRPIYRERVIEWEDNYGNPCEYREDVLFAEFCMRKGDYILKDRDCRRCPRGQPQQSDEPVRPQFEYPLAG